MFVSNVASAALFAAASFVVLRANTGLQPPLSAAETSMASGRRPQPSAALIAVFAVATVLWIVWVLPRLRLRNPAVLGSVLLSVGGIEAAATTALSGRVALPPKVVRSVASGLMWVWLGTWAMARRHREGSVYFGMTAVRDSQCYFCCCS